MFERNALHETGNRLSAELKAYARRRSRLTISSMGALFPVTLVFGMFAAAADIIIIADLIFVISEEPAPQPFKIFALSANIPTVILLLFLLKKRIMSYQKYLFVLINGRITDAVIMNIDREWNVQMNDTPRTVVDFEIEGRVIRIKTFDAEILDYCSGGGCLQLLWHGDVPDVIIPAEGIERIKEKIGPESYSV